MGYPGTVWSYSGTPGSLPDWIRTRDSYFLRSPGIRTRYCETRFLLRGPCTLGQESAINIRETRGPCREGTVNSCGTQRPCRRIMSGNGLALKHPKVVVRCSRKTISSGKGIWFHEDLDFSRTTLMVLWEFVASLFVISVFAKFAFVFDLVYFSRGFVTIPPASSQGCLWIREVLWRDGGASVLFRKVPLWFCRLVIFHENGVFATKLVSETSCSFTKLVATARASFVTCSPAFLRS